MLLSKYHSNQPACGLCNNSSSLYNKGDVSSHNCSKKYGRIFFSCPHVTKPMRVISASVTIFVVATLGGRDTFMKYKFSFYFYPVMSQFCS